MVEKTHAGEAHYHAVIVAGFDDVIVSDRAAGFSDISYAALGCSFNVITEGEECIAAECNALDCCKVCFLFFFGEGFGSFGEVFLPFAVCEHVVAFIRNINVDCVVSVRSADSIKEGKVKNLFVLSEMPDISFVAGKACAMDS